MQPLLSPSTIYELREIFHLTDKEILTLSQRRSEDKVNEAIETIKNKVAWKEKIPDLAVALKEQLTGIIIGPSSTLPIPSLVEKEAITNENKKLVKKDTLIKDNMIVNYLNRQPSIWREICEIWLEGSGEKTFKSWMLNISFVEIKNNKFLILKASSPFIRDYVKNNYGARIEEIARQFIPTIQWVEMKD